MQLVEIIAGLLRDRFRGEHIEIEYSDVTFAYEIKVGRIGAVEVAGGVVHAFEVAGEQPGEGK